MAVVPSLQLLAALTLFRNTGYGEGSVADYCLPYTAPATTIQKTIRSYLARARALLGELQGRTGRMLRAPSTCLRIQRQLLYPTTNTPLLDYRAMRIHGERLTYKYHK